MRRVVAALVCVAACAGPQTKKAAVLPQQPRAAEAAPTPKPPASARERLISALRALERPGPVLDALPAAARLRLRSRVDQLDSARRAELAQDDGALAENLPLLHLAADGNAARALFAIATTPVATTELNGLLAVEPGAAEAATARPLNPDLARIAIVNELARRAALQFLRERALDLRTSPERSPLICRLIERMALTIQRPELIRLARELLVEIDPKPENLLRLAQIQARLLDSAAARHTLGAIGAAKPSTQTALADTERLIETAARVERERSQARDPLQRLALASALLELGRSDDARAVLEPVSGEAQQHLGLAAALALALTHGSLCPSLPPDVGTPPLCAAAWRSDPATARAVSLLEAAWKSGAGRDASSIESYFGIVHIIPLMHTGANALAQNSARTELLAALSALETKINETVPNAPGLAGLALFVRALALGLDQTRADSDAGLSPKTRDELYARALALAGTRSRFTEAALLAVCGLLARQRDISALLDATPESEHQTPLASARAALQAWSAVTSKTARRMDSARSELATLMSSEEGDPITRARLVLTMAEAEAALQHSERAYQVLARVAGQLLEDNEPPELALRAVLDAAGAFARTGRLAQARELLRKTSGMKLPAELVGARNLQTLIQGYELVLGSTRSEGTTAATFEAARHELSALLQQQSAGSVRLWIELWQHELDALKVEAACPKSAPACAAAQARKLRRIAFQRIDERVGSEARGVLLGGTLPSGTFELSFHFSAERGIEPRIAFDPNFLAVEVPKIELDLRIAN